eukprot:403335315
MNKLKQQNLLTVICEAHQTQTASFYCLQCEIPVCTHCKLDTHKDHQIVIMSQTLFTSYSTNVMRIFDEYSVDNMKTLLCQQSQNEIQLNSSQFKEMLTKVERMLGPHIDEVEDQLIDFQSYLVDPQNRLPKVMQKQHQPTIDGHSEFDNKLQYDQIIKQMNESQAQMREEFKQTLNAFEVNQNYANNQIQQQVDYKIKASEDKYQRTFDEFKSAIHSNIKGKFKGLDQINVKFNQQNQQLSNFNDIVQSVKLAQDQQIKIQSTRQMEYKESLQRFSQRLDAINLKFEQERKDSKKFNNAFEQKLNNLEQELNSVKVSNKKEKTQLLFDIDQNYKQYQKLQNLLQEKLKRFVSSQVIEENKLIQNSYNQIQSSQNYNEYKNHSNIFEDEEQNSQILVNPIKTMVLVPSDQIENYWERKYSLLYKGSSDGFRSQDFNNRFNNIGQKTSPYILDQYDNYDISKADYISLDYQDTSIENNSCEDSDSDSVEVEEQKDSVLENKKAFDQLNFQHLSHNQNDRNDGKLCDDSEEDSDEEYYEESESLISNDLSAGDDDEFSFDPEAIVFSLSKRSIHKQFRDLKAIQHHEDYFCLFGYDICIKDQCDQNSSSLCDLGQIYKLPEGYEYRSDEAKSYLAGQFWFKVLEIEIYQFS